MAFLDQLSPVQKQMLLAGAPVVAVFALVASRKKQQAPTGQTQPIALGGGGVGTDQLAAFESSVTDVLSGLEQSISDLLNNPNGSSQVPPAKQQPAPTQQPTQQPAYKIGIPSSTIIGLPNGAQLAAGLVAPSSLGVSYVNPDTIIYNPTGGSETALFASQFETLSPEAQAYLKAIASGN